MSQPWNQSTRWRIIPKLSVLNPEWADWRFSKQAKKDLRGLSSPLGEGEKEDVSRKESLSCTGRNGMRSLPHSTLKSAGFCKLSTHRYGFRFLSVQRRCSESPKSPGNFPSVALGKLSCANPLPPCTKKKICASFKFNSQCGNSKICFCWNPRSNSVGRGENITLFLLDVFPVTQWRTWNVK